ncbi:hypothetical protein [Streptomyces sp. NPDC002463]|uniref:hypothetical protein n=1 Tax=Streptomyces sp. NPDC002463 TaxID=3364645 RepID=UPI00367F6295
MNGIEPAPRTLNQGEGHLIGELTDLAERHRAEHEIHHVAADLATWSGEHVERLREAAARHGLDLDTAQDARFAAFGTSRPATLATLPDPGLLLLLLRDLREVHLAATCNSLHWEMLAQVAQTSKDTALLSLAAGPRRPVTLRSPRAVLPGLTAPERMRAGRLRQVREYASTAGESCASTRPGLRVATWRQPVAVSSAHGGGRPPYVQAFGAVP